MINPRAKHIFGKECFKISGDSGADQGAERIIGGLKMGKSNKIPWGPAALGPPGLAVAWGGSEENGGAAVCPLFLNPLSVLRLGQLSSEQLTD